MPTQRPPSSASVLFSPVELHIYQRWRSRRVYGVSENFTPVPTALEYAAYQEYREQERTPRNYAPNSETSSYDNSLDKVKLPVAENCQHPLHPAHIAQTVPGSWIEDGKIPDTPTHCPVCTFHLQQTLIDALGEKWKGIGGPWRRIYRTQAERNKYVDTNRAHAKARMNLANTIRVFEDGVQLEADWELAHPEKEVTQGVKEHGAATALALYQASIVFPARLTGPDEVPPVTLGRKRAAAKHLTYSPDTPEETNHRPSSLWFRRGSQKTDSPHACLSEEGYWDTSNYNNWHFAVSQCRILLLRFVSLPMTLEYEDINIGPDRGQDNPHVVMLIELIEEYMATLPDDGKACWTNYLKHTEDMFLVWKSEKLEGEGVFNMFERMESLVGSHVEAYARQIGDIDDEEWAAREVLPVDGKVDCQVHEEEVDDANSLTCEAGCESEDNVSTSSPEFEDGVLPNSGDSGDSGYEWHGESTEVAEISKKDDLKAAPHWLEPDPDL